MKFLVNTKSKFPVPPEVAPSLIDAAAAWAEAHSKSGKMEAVWGYAGMAGGGGILNVESHAELDAIMVGFPFGPFSEVEVIPLVDLSESLARSKAAFQAMAGG